MRNKNRGLKVLSMIAVGGMVLQSGCLGGLTGNVWKGFGYSIGAIPAGIVADAFITPLLGNFLGGGTAAAGG